MQPEKSHDCRALHVRLRRAEIDAFCDWLADALYFAGFCDCIYPRGFLLIFIFCELDLIPYHRVAKYHTRLVLICFKFHSNLGYTVGMISKKYNFYHKNKILFQNNCFFLFLIIIFMSYNIFSTRNFFVKTKEQKL